MTDVKELKRLRDEERTLISLASLLTDQLNRLKVEELALLNKRRLQTTPAESHLTASSRNEQEVYLAEEMTLELAQNQAAPGQETIQILSTASLENFIEENRQISHDNHVTQQSNEDSQLTQQSNEDSQHVVPINLTVNQHHEVALEEMEEEEEEEENDDTDMK